MSHQERVAKQYEGLCIKCLRRRNNDWDNEDTYPHLCEVCKWFIYLKRGVIKDIPNSIVNMMTDEEKKCLAT